MLYRERIAFCSQIHTKHTNTLCGQNVELYIKTVCVQTVDTLNVTHGAHKLTTGLQKLNTLLGWKTNPTVNTVATRQTRKPKFEWHQWQELFLYASSSVRFPSHLPILSVSEVLYQR